MKIGRRRAQLLLLLLTSILSCEAASPNDALSEKSTRQPRAGSDSSEPAVVRAAPVGTEHAPIDGRDGMPHEGPWVETEGDRNRKKSKETDPDDILISSGSQRKVIAEDTPQVNDGVMDDPDRKSPEGARGTEGGVSERSRDGRLVHRVPEQPKEAPPMPHSEREKAKVSDVETEETDEDGTKKVFSVKHHNTLQHPMLTSSGA